MGHAKRWVKEFKRETFNIPTVFSCFFHIFFKKVIGVINVFILCVNITKLSFVCTWIKFNFTYFQAS